MNIKDALTNLPLGSFVRLDQQTTNRLTVCKPDLFHSKNAVRVKRPITAQQKALLISLFNKAHMF